jgi:hypothetical protein
LHGFWKLALDPLTRLVTLHAESQVKLHWERSWPALLASDLGRIAFGPLDPAKSAHAPFSGGGANPRIEPA